MAKSVTYMQGETIRATAYVCAGGLVVDTPHDDPQIIRDLTGYVVSILIYSNSVEYLFSTNSTAEGVSPITIGDDGALSLTIEGDKTRTMQGVYYMEAKVEKDDEVIVSDKVEAFTVIESRIGSMQA